MRTPRVSPFLPSGSLLATALAAGAFLTVCVLGASQAWGAGVPITEATADQKAAAQARYEAGTKLFGAGKYDAALKEFNASYDTVASPNAHLMIARTLSETGDVVRAYNELSVVEKEAKVSEKYTPTLDQSATLRGELLKKVAIVVVSVSGGAGGVVSVKVGGADVAMGEQFAVAPGPTEVVALVDGKEQKRETATLAPGEIHPFRFDIAATKAAPSSHSDDHPDRPGSRSGDGRTGFWVGAGVFGAIAVGGFVLAGVEWSQASSGFSQLTDDCKAHKFTCNDAKPSGEYAKQKDSINTKRTLTIAGDVGGGIAAAAAVTFLVVGLTRPKHTQESAIELHVGPTALHLDGRF